MATALHQPSSHICFAFLAPCRCFQFVTLELISTGYLIKISKLKGQCQHHRPILWKPREGLTSFCSGPCTVVSSGHVPLGQASLLHSLPHHLCFLRPLDTQIIHMPAHPPTDTKRKLLQPWSVQRNYFHLFPFTAVALRLRGAAPKPGCLGFNPGSATYWLFDLEQVTFSATVFS